MKMSEHSNSFNRAYTVPVLWQVQRRRCQHPLSLPAENGLNPGAWHQAARQLPSKPDPVTDRMRLSLDHFRDLDQVLTSVSHSFWNLALAINKKQETES